MNFGTVGKVMLVCSAAMWGVIIAMFCGLSAPLAAMMLIGLFTIGVAAWIAWWAQQ